jgi:exo-1,4-beta-D-glucosaminidase
MLQTYGRASLLLPLLATIGSWAGAAEPGWPLQLREGWRLQSSAKVTAGGDALSQPGFDTTGWHPATVPTTVVAALVADGTYPDPDYGMNLREIPGTTYPIGKNFSLLPMPKDSPFAVSWWYRTEFTLPDSVQGRTLWLRFGGINYRANIWLNGKRLADDATTAGAWRIHELNVTNVAAAGPNALAVEVFAPTGTPCRRTR